MSSSDRIQHTGLVTQQRRLRHLCSLSARNIQVGTQPDATPKEKESLIETYFTLHIWPSCQTVYTSEKINNSLNPTWRSFDLQMSCPDLDVSQSTILVRMWGGQDSECSLVIEWLVNLRGLCYLGTQIHKDGVRYQPNSLIFGMFQGFYGASDNLLDSAVQNYFQTSIEVEQSAAILSYKTFSLGRLHTTQRAIRQTEATVTKVRSSIVHKLTLAKKKTVLRSGIEELKLRLGILKGEMERQEVLMASDCKRCTKTREVIDERAQAHKLRCERMRSEKDEWTNQLELLRERKEQLQKLSAQYAARKTTLIGELADIYPVVEVANNEHTILGIRLPNAENYSGTDDMVVSTGLGHTCHLILMMSQILKLPLRYPMIHYGSRSIVRDHITEALAEKDRDFPLYSRGKERFQFNYALYLLNRNIAQLRFALGVQTTDLRATLPNLKTLLELKWGVKNSTDSMIYQSPRSLRQQGSSSTPPQQRTTPANAQPYPVQAPPVYSQVDSSRSKTVPNTPPPVYQQPDAGRTPPASPFVELISPFEELTLETEPTPTLPIPIPSVDMAAKDIEAKQAMLVNRQNGTTVQTTALVEPHRNTDLEESLSDVDSTGTLQPRHSSETYQKQQSSWPTIQSVGEDNEISRTLEKSLDVDQTEMEKSLEVFTLSLGDEGNELESPRGELQTTSLDFSPDVEGDSTALPKFAPSGQLIVSEQSTAEPAAQPPADNKQVNPSSMNSNHNSSLVSLPDFQTASKPETKRASPDCDSTNLTQTPDQVITSSTLAEPMSKPNSAHNMHNLSQSPKISFIDALNFDENAKVTYPQDNDRPMSIDRASNNRSPVEIPQREPVHSGYSTESDSVYQFDDLGSRTEALARHESFSSFKKASSPAKAHKFGKT
ncbi:UV radiation resistance-associated gene protein-like isoform X1 [Asterias rubens]|uniref:UV radiation resistance-associated gene protein-like isoform X1 n=1 Tax=Asterias rubens TaxID=7604 RepID=UPI001455C428|nr:UV radiation resistance-associated gene protein-like isoform X1 [Asterias rubens]